MPYVAHDFEIDSVEVKAGTWVPEFNWPRWQERAETVLLPDLNWRYDRPMHSPPPPLPDDALAVLGSDIASAQRDAFLYGNLVERLKNAPNDETADQVVEHMQELGFASATWPEEVGGPPRPESPRPFRKVLDWLFRLAAQAQRFLLNCVNFVMTSLQGVTAVAVGVSWGPPSVSFEWPTASFKQPANWKRVQEFFTNIVREQERNTLSA